MHFKHSIMNIVIHWVYGKYKKEMLEKIVWVIKRGTNCL